MAANMYRVGDYVYFEGSNSSPYQIRRIEELNKTPNGNVEAKVMCFYRRRDISGSLIVLADKHQVLSDDGTESDDKDKDISDKQRHQLKHREVFLSRQVETLPATHIRGKCVVTLLNETESLLSYLNKEDTFFYSLVYDPQQKTLLADRGEIRVGQKYQAEPLPSLLTNEDDDDRKLEEMEELIWTPYDISNEQIDKFIILARSVGTFARALDCTSTVRQPSLHMSAAAASRDITLFHSMHTLHKHSYDISLAVSSLVPSSGPVLCRDEMEEWSASEANLFEDAVEKYGKDFADIRQDFLPWKTLKSVIEYYYMWKTTDRYVQQKRIKAAEAETKLKQVYIPTYNKPNPSAIINNKVNGVEQQVSGRACESCYTSTSNQWYAWGPTHMQCRLCSNCWTYWKKYGGLKMQTRFDGERPAPNNRQERIAHMQAMRNYKCTISSCEREFKIKTHLVRHLATAHGLGVAPGSPKPAMKTRAAFCLITTSLTRISRRLCQDILRPKYAARHPFNPIDVATIKHECQLRLSAMSSYSPKIKLKVPATLDPVVAKLGIDITKEKPALLSKTDGASSDTRSHQPSIMRKRGYEQSNGIDGVSAAKRANMSVIRQGNVIRQMNMEKKLGHHQMNGRSKGQPPRSLKMQMISWIDAPDDVYFVATDATRKLRRKVNMQEFKRGARNPWRKMVVTTNGTSDIVMLD